MRSNINAIIIIITSALLGACDGVEPLEAETGGEALYPLSSSIWRQLSIPVCWENALPGQADEIEFHVPELESELRQQRGAA